MSRSRDQAMMQRCLDLAAKAEGRTSPNPMVGAVVARGGTIVAEAYHRRAGGPHAEVAALRLAGAAARGSTLYSNLEPCKHFGRTPPCVDAIVQAGVRRVVASHRDPFPLVDGRGLSALRRAGVRVDVGLLRREAMRLNERYITWVIRGRPFVLAKIAMTMDGRIATVTGASRWITSARARSLAHRLRSSYDAVMIGATTVAVDDPLLNARRGGTSRSGSRQRQPLRIVLDGRLRMSPRARLLSPFSRRAGGQVLIYTRRSSSEERARRLERRGAEVVRVASAGAWRSAGIDIRAVLRDLAARGVTSVMIEGGGEVIWSALEARVVDKISWFIAPVIVGGRGAVPAVGGSGFPSPARGIRLDGVSVNRVGRDLLIEAYIGRRL